MFREIAIIFLTLALIPLSFFSRDIAKGLWAGNREAVVNGFINSMPELAIAIIVVIAIGWWLVKDDRARRREEKQRHTELIDIINEVKKRLPKGGGNGESGDKV